MASEPRHRIQTFEIELDVDSPELGRRLLEQVSRLHERRIASLLDRVLSQLSGPERLDRIERLELELGELPLQGFEDELLRALEAALREALRRRLSASASVEQQALELLELWARTGVLPWWAGRDGEVVRRAITRASRGAERAWHALLAELVDDPAALARLAAHVDDAVLAQQLGTRELGGELAQRLSSLEQLLARASAAPQRPALHVRAALLAGLADRRGLRGAALLDAIVVALIERVPSLFDALRVALGRGEPLVGVRESLVRVVGEVAPHEPSRVARPAASREAGEPGGDSIVRDDTGSRELERTPRDADAPERAREPREEPGGVEHEGEPREASPEPSPGERERGEAEHEAEHDEVAHRSPDRPDDAEPDRAEPARAESDDAAPDHTEPNHTEPDDTEPDHAEPNHTEPDDAEPRDAEPDHTEPRTVPSPLAEPRQPDRPRPTARVDTPALRAARRRALDRLEVVEVEDAGLVLLWPFLPRFFARVGLLDAERRFVDEPARMQAIALLSVLAREQPEPPEWQLPLAKLLCGCAIEQPFELERALEREQLDECEALLAAVIANAEILRNMPVASFRREFVARPGLLGVIEGSWLLRVERASHDLVLDRFPWSWSWLKLPWMNDPLRVDW